MQSISSRIPDGGCKVYQHFGLDCTSSHKQPIPNSGNDKPSISFRRQPSGDYIFTAWATGNKGDAISFVRWMHDCTASEALRIISGIYGGIDEHPSRTIIPSVSNQNGNRLPKSEKKYLISGSMAAMPCSDHDHILEYLSKKSGGFINRESLKTYGVNVIEAYRVRMPDGLIKRIDKRPTNATNPFIIYDCDHGGGDLMMIKAPFSDSEVKTWYLMTESMDRSKEKSGRGYIFGSSAIYGKCHRSTAFMTEGQEDAIALFGAGFPSFTFGSARFSITPAEIKHLKGQGIRRIVIVYDADDTGRKAAQALMKDREKYREQGLEILDDVRLPKLSGSKESKDVCDYLKTYGRDDDFIQAMMRHKREQAPSSPDDPSSKRQPVADMASKEAAQTASERRNDAQPAEGMGNPAPTSYTRRGDTIEMTCIETDSHVLDAKDAIVEALFRDRRVQIIAPTGSGKTWAAMDIAKSLAASRENGGFDLRAVIAFPTSLAVDQAAEKYGVIGINGKTKGDEEYKSRAKTDRVIATTIDSIGDCGLFDILIVDELHEIVKSHHYRYDATGLVREKMIDTRYVIGITATPDPVISHDLDFKTIKIVPKRRQILKIHPHYISDGEQIKSKKEAMIVAWCKQQVSKGKTAVVRINDGGIIDAVKMTLESVGIDGVYRMTRQEKDPDEPIYHSISMDEKPPDGCKVILSTCVLDTGVNIKGKTFAVMIVCDGMNKDADNVIQFSARFRDMAEIDVHLLFDRKAERTAKDCTALQGFHIARDEYSRKAEAVNMTATLLRMHESEMMETFGLEKPYVRAEGIFDLDDGMIRYDKTSGRFDVNILACNAKAVLDAGERSSGDTLSELAAMNAAGIAVIRMMDAEGYDASEDADIVRESIAAVKKDREEKKNEVLRQIEDNETSFVRVLHDVSNDSSLKAAIESRLGYRIRLDEEECSFRDTIKPMLQKKQTETIAKAFLQDIEDGFTKPDAITLQKDFSGRNKRSNIKRNLKHLQILEMPDELFTGGRDAIKKEERNYLREISAKIKDHSRLSSDDIRQIVASCGRADRVKMKEKHIVSFITTLFDAKRITARSDDGKSFVKVWQIGSMVTAAAYCERLGLGLPNQRKTADSAICVHVFDESIS